MGILCVFCVYDTIGNRCFEKTSFPKKEAFYRIFKTHVVIEGNMPILAVTLVLQCSVKRKKMNPQMSGPANIDRAKFV